MSCFRVISSNIVSCAFISSLIHSFVFLSSSEILAGRLNASISVALIQSRILTTHKKMKELPSSEYKFSIVCFSIDTMPYNQRHNKINNFTPVGCFTTGERLPGTHYVGVVQPLVAKGNDRYCELARRSRVQK